MTFCANCGFPISGKYCGQCGTAAGPPPKMIDPEEPVDEALPDNAAAALSYMLGPVTAALFLSLDKYNRSPFVRFHAWQSMLFSCSVTCLYLVLMILAFQSVFLGIALMAISGILLLALLLLWMFVMWQTLNGKKIVLPLVGPLAEKM